MCETREGEKKKPHNLQWRGPRCFALLCFALLCFALLPLRGNFQAGGERLVERWRPALYARGRGWQAILLAVVWRSFWSGILIGWLVCEKKLHDLLCSRNALWKN